jgi:hypothetical protein
MNHNDYVNELIKIGNSNMNSIRIGTIYTIDQMDMIINGLQRIASNDDLNKYITDMQTIKSELNKLCEMVGDFQRYHKTEH